MAVSKRLRFEVFRRDNHTCRYCGRHAPEVPIRVDHVIPVALGGSDEPSNLVAACHDCNSGKSSVPAGAELVQDVANDAVRWANAMRQAAEESRLHDNTEVYEGVVKAWTSYRRNREIPADYKETLDQFLNAGLPADDIVQMAHVADAKPNLFNRWSYFCGCCWTRIRKLQERAQEILDRSPADQLTESCTTQWTLDEIREIERHALGTADAYLGDELITAVACRHRDSGHCGDALCIVEWSNMLEWLGNDAASEGLRRYSRNEAVDAEAEALLDG